jgi:broad specificity phosphatase PhoE
MAQATTRVFLLRHGEVDPAWNGRIYGALDVPLSPAGEREARRAAERLAGIELATVVSSGLTRTEFGAALLRAPRGLSRCDDRELRELERGAWAGLTLAELEAREPGAFARWCAAPSRERSPGGESLADLWARVGPRFEHWIARHAGASLALVAHGWVVRVILCRVLGLELDRAVHLDVRTGDLFALTRHADGRFELDGFACDAVPSPRTRSVRSQLSE